MTDRDKLIELLKETEEHPEKTCPHYLEADCFDCPYDRGEDCDREARKADYLIANGVIVPVRCKDCKYCDFFYPQKEKGKEAISTFYCNLFKGDMKETDFCSYGELKELGK